MPTYPVQTVVFTAKCPSCEHDRQWAQWSTGRIEINCASCGPPRSRSI